MGLSSFHNLTYETQLILVFCNCWDLNLGCPTLGFELSINLYCLIFNPDGVMAGNPCWPYLEFELSTLYATVFISIIIYLQIY